MEIAQGSLCPPGFRVEPYMFHESDIGIYRSESLIVDSSVSLIFSYYLSRGSGSHCNTTQTVKTGNMVPPSAEDDDG